MHAYLVLVPVFLRLISASSNGVLAAQELDKRHEVTTTATTTTQPSHLTTDTSQSPTHTTHLRVAATSTTIRHAHVTTTATTVIPASRILPTYTPTNSIAHMDLSSSLVNKNLLNLQTDGHDVPVICINCSTTGKVEITGHDLRWDESVFDGSHDQGLGFREGRFRAHLPYGLAGHIELSFKSASSISHFFNLTQLPLVGFFFPEAGTVGVSLDLGIPVSMQFDGKADISFGFEFSIPKGSYIDIGVADLQKSGAKGFTQSEGSNFQLLPSNFSVPDLDLKLSTGLDFSLLFGAELLSNEKVAEFGARFKLPQISIEERQVRDVDDKCNPLKQGTTTRTDTAGPSKTTTTVKATSTSHNITRDLARNYTNLIPTMEMRFDVFGGVGFKDTAGREVDISMTTRTDIPIIRTAWDLSTACISNHPVSSTPATTTSSTTSTETSKSTPLTAQSSPTHKGIGTRQASEPSSVTMSLLFALLWLLMAF